MRDESERSAGFSPLLDPGLQSGRPYLNSITSKTQGCRVKRFTIPEESQKE